MSKYDDKGLEEILLSDELDLKDPELYDRLSLFFQALAKKMHQAEDIKKSSPKEEKEDDLDLDLSYVIGYQHRRYEDAYHDFYEQAIHEIKEGDYQKGIAILEECIRRKNCPDKIKRDALYILALNDAEEYEEKALEAAWKHSDEEEAKRFLIYYYTTDALAIDVLSLTPERRDKLKEWLENEEIG